MSHGAGSAASGGRPPIMTWWQWVGSDLQKWCRPRRLHRAAWDFLGISFFFAKGDGVNWF